MEGSQRYMCSHPTIGAEKGSEEILLSINVIADGRANDTSIEPTTLIGAELEEKFHERAKQMAARCQKTMRAKHIPSRKTKRLPGVKSPQKKFRVRGLK